MTVMNCIVVLAPCAFVALNDTFHIPAASKRVDGFCSDDAAVDTPLNIYQYHDVGLFVDVSVKCTLVVSYTVVGLYVKFATGARGITEDAVILYPDFVLQFVPLHACNETVYVPGIV